MPIVARSTPAIRTALAGAGFRAAVALGGCCAAAACRGQTDPGCVAQFQSAQSVVLGVDGNDLASVSGSVAAVEQAIETCAAAKQTGEVEELRKALSQLSQHRDRLVRRNEAREQRTETSPEELARLIEQGDPRCPRGQGYLHSRSGKRITCVGPQPIDMSRAQAEQYFQERGYRRLPSGDGAELRFEYGAELIVFAYGAGSEAAGPGCVTLYPPPDRSWQEATARLTGVAPARLKANQPIRRPSGAVPFSVEESPDKVIVRIGACSR